MRLIANHIVKNSAGETYLQGEVSRTEPKVGPPAVGHAFHVYCSVHNTGAANLVREVAAVLKLNLKLTSDINRLEECDCMLVYLTRLTWTQGDTSVALAADVQRAMDGGVPLKLAHESAPHRRPNREEYARLSGWSGLRWGTLLRPDVYTHH